jgi:flagellar biogenesis protein FliO
MTIANWASLIVAIIAIITAFIGAIRWLVKHFLYELRPNGGGSLKDQVNRLEKRVDEIINMLLERK